MKFDFVEGLSVENINQLYEDVAIMGDTLISAYVTCNVYCIRYGEQGTRSHTNQSVPCSWYYFNINAGPHYDYTNNSSLNICRSYSDVYWYAVYCRDT